MKKVYCKDRAAEIKYVDRGLDCTYLGSVYKENENFLVAYSTREMKELSWSTNFNFKVIPKNVSNKYATWSRLILVTIKDLSYIRTLKTILVKGGCPSKTAKSSKSYEKKISNKAKAQFKVPVKTNVGVEIDLFYKGIINKPNADNALKLILDALKGIAYYDDKQVVKTRLEVHDTDNVMTISDKPILLIDLLMEGVSEYTVIRIHERAQKKKRD